MNTDPMSTDPMRTEPARTVGAPTWWRANRWWLAVLPLALVACLLASSFRVQAFWWEEGTHHQVGSSLADGFEEATLVGYDGHGRLERTFSAKAGVPREVSTITLDRVEQPVPEGSVAWQVPIEFRAAPDQELNLCRVAGYDAEGRQFGGADLDLLDQRNLCVPIGQEGPGYATFREIPRGQVEPGHERPETWTVEPVILTDAGTTLTSLRIWFNYPQYVQLPIPD